MKHSFLVTIETPMGIVPTAKMIASDIGSWMGSLPLVEQVDVDVLEVRYIGHVNHAKDSPTGRKASDDPNLQNFPYKITE